MSVERLNPRESVWPLSETGLTDFGCQQLGRVVFRSAFWVVVGCVLHLGPVALQWLRGLGKGSLRRCPSEIGFIGRILELNFYQLPFCSPSLVRRSGPSQHSTHRSFGEVS
jgi:hypothetical protein